uniref:Small ribosomal subunit protein mS23 n=1 Tax=Oryzias sinensis TaxID=183150 RepID=A0A8C7XDA0_9TELE
MKWHFVQNVSTCMHCSSDLTSPRWWCCPPMRNHVMSPLAIELVVPTLRLTLQHSRWQYCTLALAFSPFKQKEEEGDGSGGEMAGSRLERFGTVFSRVRDLMRSGVIQKADKPIWYDVYEVFPPKREPLYVKQQSRPAVNKQDPVPEIFYREDEVRAKFYEQYGTGPRPLDLSNPNFVSTCQRFVTKFNELRNHSDLSDSALFEETGKALLSEGVVLKRRGAVPAESSRDAVLDLKLTDMLAELQNAASSPSTHNPAEPELPVPTQS